MNNTPITIRYLPNPSVDNASLNVLFTSAWEHHTPRDFGPILHQSLTYICAYANDTLVGFVNLAWDGGCHAFLLDTTVHSQWQKRGIGKQLVLHAVAEAQGRGIEWLHVDYEPSLDAFYRSCGFRPTLAGLIQLPRPA